MNNLRMKMRAHPITAAFLVMLAYLAGDRLIGQAFELLPINLFTDTLYQIASMLWAFTLVALSGYLHAYKTRGLRRTLLIGLPYILLFGVFLFGTVGEHMLNPATQWVSPGYRFLGVLTLLGIGFCEESIFRGAAVNLLAEKGLNTRRDVFKVVFLSGFLFGALHLTNALSGVTLYSALFQSIGAFAGGCLFGAYYLRGGSLWGVMLIHALQDSSGLFDALFIAGGDTTEALNSISANVLFISAIFLLITLFLLRKSGCKKIIAQRAKDFPAA